MEQQEDGDWVVTYEGFSEARAYNLLIRQHELAKDLTVTHKPWDLVVTLVLSSAFEPSFASVEVRFHESAEYRQAEPNVTVSYDLMLGDSSGAENELSSVKLSKYTELPAVSSRIEAQMPKGILESYTLFLHTEATVDENPLALNVEITVIFYD